MRITLIMICLCSLLAACQQSPRKNYYVLSGPAEKIETNAEITQTIGIGPIELPEYLQRQQMVRHNDKNSLNVADNHYWAEPLDKGIARVIALHLSKDDKTRVLLPFPWRNDNKPTQSLRLYIHDLKLIDSKATLNATWELFDVEHKHLLHQQHFVRSITTKDNPLGMANAYSELIAQLAAEMNTLLSANQ